MYDNAVWETGWGTSLSLKTTDAVGDGGTPNSFEIANGAATSGQMNGWSSAYYRIAPIAYDQWVNFTIHVYWATDSTGYFEVYENGKLMTLTGDSVPSFSGTRVNGPNYGVSNQMVSEFDWYRGPSDLPSLLYLDNLKIGDTYSGVQPGYLGARAEVRRDKRENGRAGRSSSAAASRLHRRGKGGGPARSRTHRGHGLQFRACRGVRFGADLVNQVIGPGVAGEIRCPG